MTWQYLSMTFNGGNVKLLASTCHRRIPNQAPPKEPLRQTRTDPLHELLDLCFLTNTKVDK